MSAERNKQDFKDELGKLETFLYGANDYLSKELIESIENVIGGFGSHLEVSIDELIELECESSSKIDELQNQIDELKEELSEARSHDQ